MANKIRLQFYRERYNTDNPEYYLGDNDIYAVFYFTSIEDLKEQWSKLISVHNHYLEGETYSAWDDKGNALCGGAFDPGDITLIEEAYKEEK